jgi:hypothetical protein
MMHRSRSALPLVLLGVTAFAVPLACGGSDKPANDPSKVTTTSSAATTTASATSTSASASPSASGSAAPTLATILTTDPAQLAPIIAAALSATPLLQAPPTANDPLDTGIKATAAKQAPGMQPEGDLFKGDLTEGGHQSMSVTLSPGKCYAVIGYSATVKDLDLRLLAPPFYNVLAGEDTTDDNAPVIGKAPNPMCPVLPVGIPYKVDVMSEKGAGKVGLRLYSKPK